MSASSSLARPRAVLALLGVLCACALAYAISTLVPRDPGSPLWDGVVYVGVFALAAAACFVRARHAAEERWCWAALGLSLALSAAGERVWAAQVSGGDAIPFPSVADALYVASYPPAYAAVVLLMRRRIAHVRAGMWLDGLVSGLALAGLAAAIAFPVIVPSLHGGAATVATTLAYPIGDLVLLAMVGGVVGVAGGRLGWTWALLGAGLAMWAACDTVYLVLIAHGAYEESTLLDAGWPVGAALMALAAWTAPLRAEARGGDLGALLVPVASTLVAVGVLVAVGSIGSDPVAVGLAGAAVVAATARMFLSFREVRRLADSRELALTDDLTGLPNRRALLRRLEVAAAADEHLALLLVDLDHFKELNDTLGHHVGDLLLQQAAERMASVLRPSDLLARLGGDEFALVLSGRDGVSASRVGERLRRRLEEPFVLDGIPVQIEGSVGVAARPDHAAGVTELLQFADVAMYQAKSTRAGVAVYTASRDEHSRARLAVAAQVREGIVRGELELHLQPQVDLATRALFGAEALIRWRHPSRGLLSPAQFLPAVEQTNVMRPLTARLLRDVLDVAAAWRRAGTPLSVAVNVGAPNLLDLDFPRVVARALRESGAVAGDLRLEVTENSVMVDADRAAAVLGGLRDLGVGLALDDFGTGRSSLARLRHLPVDELKIDRAFVLGMCADAQDAAIVRAAATLGAELDLVVVAEGVEDDAAWDAVHAAGCHIAQGYLLSPPLPVAAFEAWRAAWDEQAPRALAAY